MSDFRHSWSDWLKEGQYVSYMQDSARIYEHIVMRDLAHYVYTWPELIVPGAVSGPFVPAELEITRGYDARTNTNQIWQLIFGIKGQAYIYIELPTDIHRHGLPKIAKPSSAYRAVSQFEEWMSSFLEPTFITEHFMMRPEAYNIGFDAFNPLTIAIRPDLRILIAKLGTERIGVEEDGVLTPTSPRWSDTLEQLYKRVKPQRPLSIMGVRAPAEAPAGQ